MNVFYFGCVGQAGHYMHGPNLHSDWKILRSNPWGLHVDGGLCPKGQQVQGLAEIHHKDGWTALAFWDRSVDERPNSNSAFLAEGTLDFAEMMELATAQFPSIVKRFNFRITEGTHAAQG